MNSCKKTFILLYLLSLGISTSYAQQQSIPQKVQALLNRMTLAEKIGQLNQYNGDWEATGPVSTDVGNKLDAVKRGED